MSSLESHQIIRELCSLAFIIGCIVLSFYAIKTTGHVKWIFFSLFGLLAI